MADQIRILLADDHPVVLRGLKASIQENPRNLVIAEEGDGDGALAAIKRLLPEVAILDVDMPKLDGFGVAREITKLGLTTKIIFLTLHTDEQIFDSAMQLGAKGYLLKESATQEITTAIDTIKSGRIYICSAMAAITMQRRNASPADDPLLGGLTSTERRILKSIAGGNASKDIAEELSIHFRTVENHRTNICRKLKIEGPNALLRFAMQHKDKL
jgi:DNA-binding NarL/FixJ family response regulator